MPLGNIDLSQEPLRWTGDFGKDIPGKSELAGAEGQVDLLQANYSSSNAGRVVMGGQIRPGTVSYSDIVVAKPNSGATPKLAAAFDKHLAIPEITIYQYTRDGQNNLTVSESWKLEHCNILDYQSGNVGGIDNFMIYYKRITINTFEMTDDGTLKPTGTRGYDRVANQAF